MRGPQAVQLHARADELRERGALRLGDLDLPRAPRVLQSGGRLVLLEVPVRDHSLVEPDRATGYVYFRARYVNAAELEAPGWAALSQCWSEHGLEGCKGMADVWLNETVTKVEWS